MNDPAESPESELEPAPAYAGVVRPRTVAAAAYAAAPAVAATALAWGIQAGNVALPSTAGTSIFVGAVVYVTAIAAVVENE